jgi:uncharacterized protein YbjT (DUF2867 family)
MKKLRFSGIIILTAIIGFSFIACDDGSNAVEKPQDSPNTPMFGGKTATITTTDTFTDKQWNDIVTAIVGKFSAGYNAAATGLKSTFEGVFPLTGPQVNSLGIHFCG